MALETKSKCYHTTIAICSLDFVLFFSILIRLIENFIPSILDFLFFFSHFRQQNEIFRNSIELIARDECCITPITTSRIFKIRSVCVRITVITVIKLFFCPFLPLLLLFRLLLENYFLVYRIQKKTRPSSFFFSLLTLCMCVLSN